MPDALNHEAIARALIGHIAHLPAGSVIAVQASWGRGKTDVLLRAHHLLKGMAESGEATQPLWINPWQYGTPDLITPLVLELVARVEPGKRSRSPIFRAATKTMLRAGSALLVKGASLMVPVVGPLITEVAKPVDDLIKEIFKDQRPPEPYDPIREMASTFRILVDSYRSLTSSDAHPLVVFIDDLDRCLPDYQVAILESIHFVTSADANCYFLVAIDPQLVTQAAITHYKVAAFDIEQFLDKLFDLRVNLRYMRSEDTSSMFKRLMEELPALIPAQDRLTTLLLSEYPKVFLVPALNNPRVLTRVLQRLELLLSVSEAEVRVQDDNEAFALLSWLAICERWPHLRVVPQVMNQEVTPSRLKELFLGIAVRYGGLTESSPEVATALGFSGTIGGTIISKDYVGPAYPSYPSKKSEGSDKKKAEAFDLEADRPIYYRLPPIEREPDLGIFLAYLLAQARRRDRQADLNEKGAWLLKSWMKLDRQMRMCAL